MIAHVERDQDLLLGGVKLMPASIGRALQSQIPQAFSDVILTVREGDNFTWDTANSQADVKTRNLKIASKLPADFKAIFDKWETRRKAVESH